MENFWHICLTHLKHELSAQQFNTWIKPLQFELKNDTLCLIAPNKFVLQWVKERFLLRIEAIAKELFSDNAKIELSLSKQTSTQLATTPALIKNKSDESPANTQRNLDVEVIAFKGKRVGDLINENTPGSARNQTRSKLSPALKVESVSRRSKVRPHTLKSSSDQST